LCGCGVSGKSFDSGTGEIAGGPDLVYLPEGYGMMFDAPDWRKKEGAS